MLKSSSQITKPTKQLGAPSVKSQSNSYFSDISRVMYRQQSLNRKLKHLQQQNSGLQQKIKTQEQLIKDQRTIIIYQMKQLVKVVNSKVGVFQDFQITKELMFNNQGQEDGLDGLKQLMAKYQQIQKEQKMINKVRASLDRMFQSYTTHKQHVQKLIYQSKQQHRQVQQKLLQQIHQKKSQLSQIQQQNTTKLQQIQQMEQQIQLFTNQQPYLEQQQKQLRDMIIRKQRQIEMRSQQLEEMLKWQQIVIDRKGRTDLYNQMKVIGGKVGLMTDACNRIQVQVKEFQARKKNLNKA